MMGGNVEDCNGLTECVVVVVVVIVIVIIVVCSMWRRW